MHYFIVLVIISVCVKCFFFSFLFSSWFFCHFDIDVCMYLYFFWLSSGFWCWWCTAPRACKLLRGTQIRVIIIIITRLLFRLLLRRLLQLVTRNWCWQQLISLQFLLLDNRFVWPTSILLTFSSLSSLFPLLPIFFRRKREYLRIYLN